MEYNQTAVDGSTYDNGYGICLIPVGKLFQEKFSNVNSAKSYASSDIRTYMSKNTSKYLKNVLGDHLVNRNVLLGNTVRNDGITTSYSWTTDFCTLMSLYQLFGYSNYTTNEFGNIAVYYPYDCGEANYKLPLFNYIPFACGYQYWLRATTTRILVSTNTYNYRAILAESTCKSVIDEGYGEDYSVFETNYTLKIVTNSSSSYIRPMIYIR